MKFAMCNEFCQGWSVQDAILLAADTGYQGIEIAPFTIADDVRNVPIAQRDTIRNCAEKEGIKVIGLHWLLTKPEGLHLTTNDATLRKKTTDYLSSLVDFCADLGGDRMVFGSPKSRNMQPGVRYKEAWNYAVDAFKSLMDKCQERGVTICVEPLSYNETDFIMSVEEGCRMCDDVNHPNFKVHIDVKAMCSEPKPIEEIILGAKGYVGHFHVNDANKNGPGWGNTDYAPIVKAVREIGYDDFASVEVFDFSFPPRAIAKRSLDFLQKAWA